MPAKVTCKVISNVHVTPTVFILSFTSEPGFEFKAGQFISIIIPGAGPNGRDLRRAYSIASAPETNPVELCVKLVENGPGTNYLHSLKPGDEFNGLAPYGNFTYVTPSEKTAVFISTGTGIAPFRSMIRSGVYQSNPPQRSIFLFGVRHEEELLYHDELSANEHVEWIPTVSRPTKETSLFKGRVTDYLRANPEFIDWMGSEYYLCGSGDMIKEIKEILSSHGVTKEAIHQEKYY
ncbi:MAG: hypothetical protein CL678_11375 [Bdellovibrionaceae bacterium]|nr:hypothetical protein [Pseudobdellovibrionaceae bacterium]|tara:strand:- start:202 stop:906 length:705 start_codon:yes stop_codon:yes gene_type:complete